MVTLEHRPFNAVFVAIIGIGFDRSATAQSGLRISPFGLNIKQCEQSVRTGGDGRYKIWNSTQYPYLVQYAVLDYCFCGVWVGVGVADFRKVPTFSIPGYGTYLHDLCASLISFP